MTPYLSTPTRLGNLESEAGTRAQSDIRCGVTLALTGSSQGKTEPRKATYKEMRHNEKPSILLELTPATHLV
ncbi:hypothetical protein [Nostoc favosum]|uniref:Uncharacterized protein n=1 Tax=Nostoc favosum CHAB5714 TaxID=2780399 RepID=A0ABS8I2U5_9NOSO|nr:hypothetical protein [Nostoc favosum]MCC5598382.1 hypothetical protein [Nostoc favosum CHAB5714]